MEVESPAEREPLTETQPSLRGAFEHVYGFILQAVKGDRGTARPFSKIISVANSPTSYCLFREVASARIKQAPLTVHRGGMGGE
jgi:hypothetical protein